MFCIQKVYSIFVRKKEINSKQSEQKLYNIAIGVPLPTHVPTDFIRNLVNIITTTMKLPYVKSVMYMDKGGVRTDKNRNIIIKGALEAEMDYILWLDADMIYPNNIVDLYMQHNFDIIGCPYYKRTEPFSPVCYIDGTNPIKPYRMINPLTLPKDSIAEVDGLGFGGVMVKTDVYRTMGDDMYMVYGSNFHLPFETTDQLTHDLVWCKKAKQYGYKILMHTGVKAGHISDYVVTEEDFRREKEKEAKKETNIVCIMPTIHKELAEKCAKICTSRAGVSHKMLVVEDVDRSGYVATINSVARQNPADYYVMLTDDIFPSRNWLADALKTAKESNAGLIGFNDSKWDGSIATCAMVKHDWAMKNYNGNIYYPEYFGHYNDTELTILGINDKTYVYNPHICLVEVDYEKETKKVNPKDKALFAKRKANGFDGKVTDQVLLQSYA